MAVLLKAPEPKELELNGRPISPVTSPIADAGFAAYQNSPMNGRSSAGNALEAFIAYLGERGFRGVALP
jgi:hypothetical protein